VALGGVMGGAATEVSEATTDILIEAAQFAPLHPHHGPQAEAAQSFVVPLRARRRSRAGRLGQPALLRVDSAAAGGELAEGRDRRRPGRPESEPIVLRLVATERVIGIRDSRRRGAARSWRRWAAKTRRTTIVR
jgi:phenylalanyl-tRNA synthetase beta chain